jgi:hypothetical protein
MDKMHSASSKLTGNNKHKLTDHSPSSASISPRFGIVLTFDFEADDDQDEHDERDI